MGRDSSLGARSWVALFVCTSHLVPGPRPASAPPCTPYGGSAEPRGGVVIPEGVKSIPHPCASPGHAPPPGSEEGPESANWPVITRLFCSVSAAQVFVLHSPAEGSSGRRPEQLLLGFCGTGLGASPKAADRRGQLLCKTGLLLATVGYHLPLRGHFPAARAQRIPGTGISDSSDLESKPRSTAPFTPERQPGSLVFRAAYCTKLVETQSRWEESWAICFLDPFQK